MQFLWVSTMLSACISALVMIATVLGSKSAPQEAAGYAMACAFAVVPYIFTRALQAIKGPSMGEAAGQIVKAIEQIQKPENAAPAEH